MTEDELTTIENDPSTTVTLELIVKVENAAITPGQRRALHTMMVRAAKRMGSQLALAVEDHRTVKLSCQRTSSRTGTMAVNLAEDPDAEV